MPYLLGVDCGRSLVKVLALRPDGSILQQAQVATRDDGTFSWAEGVRDFVRDFVAGLGRSPSAAGLTAPGIAALDRRSIAILPGRLAGMEGLVWEDFLDLGVSVPVLNDAQAALLGEVWLGSARSSRQVVLFALGATVGGSVLVDGRLLRGHLGRAGHFGHLPLDPDGEPDASGAPGSLGDALAEATLAVRTGGVWTQSRDLVAAVARGDGAAAAVWERMVRSLAAGVIASINLFDPEVVIIGGGLAQAGPLLFDPLERAVRRWEWQPGGVAVPVRAAALGGYAGACGAVFHAQHGGRIAL